jgi:hypothetical protein
LVLLERQAAVAPTRTGCTYVGGGNIDVRLQTAGTVVVTMTGAVVATGHPCGSAAVLEFNLDQAILLVGGRSRLSLESECTGLLRGGRIAAAESTADAVLLLGGTEIIAAGLPDRAVGGGENLTVADRCAPDDVTIEPGSYLLHARWRLAACHPKGLRGKAASAEFAPEPALDPLWVGGPRDPFHGVAKKDFGFRVSVHIVPAPAQ